MGYDVVVSSMKCLKFSLEGWLFDDLFIYLPHENNIVASFSNKERKSLSTNWRYDVTMNKLGISVHLSFNNSNLDGYGKI